MLLKSTFFYLGITYLILLIKLKGASSEVCHEMWEDEIP